MPFVIEPWMVKAAVVCGGLLLIVLVLVLVTSRQEVDL